MTQEEKFKKDMELLKENLRRTFNPTRTEKILQFIFSIEFLFLIGFTLSIIAIILTIYENR